MELFVMKHPVLPALLATATILASGSAFAATCSNTITTGQTLLTSSMGYNLTNTRNAVSTINSSNVSQLQLGFTQAEVDTNERRGAPVLTSQVMYTPSKFKVIAMDRQTGCTFWSYEIPKKSALVGGDGFRSMTYAPATLLKPAMILAGDNDGVIHAINAKTGELVWKNFVGTDSGYHRLTGTPQFAAGKLIVPMSSKEVLGAIFDPTGGCCRSHGLVVGVDAYTGKVDWTYHTTPDATLQSDLHRGPNGVPIWSSPAIDTATSTVYIGAGQNYTYPTTSNSDSVIALNLKTGAVKWIFQATKDDAWNIGCSAPFPVNGTCDEPQGPDFDFGAPPILVTVNGVKTILAGDKSGVVYSLNAATGKKNWTRRLGVGGNLGGIHWGMGVDSTKLYVAVSDVIVNKVSALDFISAGNAADASGKQMAPAPNGTPGVYAVDIKTGAVVWEKHPTHLAADGNTYKSAYSASVGVTNDVVFAGSLNGVIKAFRTTDGAEVWSYDTVKAVTDVNGAAGQGGTIDGAGMVIGGNTMAVLSGFDQFGGTNVLQAGKGNVVYMFKMP
jgi:polyvinyl alcohol dehydrogenase (cytochrome)